MGVQIAKNAPCPCGSGDKYKRCCLPKKDQGVPRSASQDKQIKVYSHRFSFLIVAAILAIGSLIYSNTLHAPFTFDDAIIEQKREQAGDASSIKSIVGDQRPIAYLSFNMNYAIGKDDPFVYHVTSISIHLLASIILYFFILTTLNLPLLRSEYGQDSQLIAAIVSLLFASHPVQTQAVTYIVQRMTSLAGMFYLLSLLAYARGRINLGAKRMAWFIGCAVAGLCALGSKEHAGTLPIVITLYEFFFFQGLDFNKIKKQLIWIASCFVSCIAVMFMYMNDFGWLLKGYDQYKFTMGEKILTEFRVIVYYISLLILPLPSRMNLDYDYPLSTSMFSPPTTFICFLLIIGILAFSFWLSKRKLLISFSIFWFFGHLVLESFLLPIEIIYEHRLYLPGVGFFILVAVGLVELARRIAKDNIAPTSLVLSGVLVLLLGWGTYERNKVWGSEIALWSDIVKKSPEKARPHNNLGKAYATAGLAAKDPVKAKELGDNAIVQYEEAVRLNPLNYVAFDNLGQAYGRKGMPELAIKACDRSAKLKPDYLPAFNNLGVAYNKVKKYDEAIKACLRALEINPRYAKSYFNLGRAYEGKGLYDKAIDSYLKAFELRPDDYNIPYNIGNAYFNQGKNDKALKFYNQALGIKPDFLNVYYNLGVIYFNKNDYKSAIAQFQKMIEINPRHAPAYERLGLLYMNKNVKEYKKALFNFKKAVEFAPNEQVAVLAKNSIKKLESHGIKLD